MRSSVLQTVYHQLHQDSWKVPILQCCCFREQLASCLSTIVSYTWMFLFLTVLFQSFLKNYSFLQFLVQTKRINGWSTIDWSIEDTRLKSCTKTYHGMSKALILHQHLSVRCDSTHQSHHILPNILVKCRHCRLNFDRSSGFQTKIFIIFHYYLINSVA